MTLIDKITFRRNIQLFMNINRMDGPIVGSISVASIDATSIRAKAPIISSSVLVATHLRSNTIYMTVYDYAWDSGAQGKSLADFPVMPIPRNIRIRYEETRVIQDELDLCSRVMSQRMRVIMYISSMHTN